MSSNPEGWAIALQRIAHEAEARTGALDLGMLGLTELPEELFALTHLRELSLGVLSEEEWEARRASGASFSVNELKSALEKLIAFGQLQTLSVSGTDIIDLAWAQRLEGLQSLDCSGTQVSDLAPLKGLTALRSLDCSSTPVSDLNGSDVVGEPRGDGSLAFLSQAELAGPAQAAKARLSINALSFPGDASRRRS